MHDLGNEREVFITYVALVILDEGDYCLVNFILNPVSVNSLPNGVKERVL